MPSAAPAKITSLRYRDRRTGRIVAEQVPGERALRWLYGTSLGRAFFRLALDGPLCSSLYGWWQKGRWTRRKIYSFVEQYRIDQGEFELPLDQYRTFNDFFTRRLRNGARPFAPDPYLLCCPADGKVLVYPCLEHNTRLPVKSCAISPASLLAGSGDPALYQGGAALVVRLAPYDYHRFHFPDAGRAGPARQVAGHYHSVNPLALARVPEVFHLNKRAVTCLDAAHFGPLAYVEIGALNVASIVQTYAPGPVERGQEKGFFQFGGSTLVLLFAPGMVRFDDDLLADSAQGLEVHVRTGERIGQRS
jgi:phosphatidylserine decarboxylase